MVWQIWCEEEKYEENLATFRYISETTGAISFKFGMQGRVNGPTIIYKK